MMPFFFEKDSKLFALCFLSTKWTTFCFALFGIIDWLILASKKNARRKNGFVWNKRWERFAFYWLEPKSLFHFYEKKLECFWLRLTYFPTKSNISFLAEGGGTNILLTSDRLFRINIFKTYSVEQKEMEQGPHFNFAYDLRKKSPKSNISLRLFEINVFCNDPFELKKIWNIFRILLVRKHDIDWFLPLFGHFRDIEIFFGRENRYFLQKKAVLKYSI